MKNKYSTYTDRELIDLLKGPKTNSDMAFTEIYDRYSNNVYAYCRRVLNNREQAEDIFQETFYQFYNHVNDKHPDGSIRGYLITIARNLCLNYKRDTKQTVQIDELEYLFKTYQDYEEKELISIVKMAMEHLDLKYREPLILRVYNGFGYSEIAEICEISTVNARALVFRAKLKMKEILKSYLVDLPE